MDAALAKGDASVNFDQNLVTALHDHGFQLPDLIDRLGNECLSSKSRVHAHHTHQVDICKDISPSC